MYGVAYRLHRTLRNSKEGGRVATALVTNRSVRRRARVVISSRYIGFRVEWRWAGWLITLVLEI